MKKFQETPRKNSLIFYLFFVLFCHCTSGQDIPQLHKLVSKLTISLGNEWSVNSIYDSIITIQKVKKVGIGSPQIKTATDSLNYQLHLIIEHNPPSSKVFTDVLKDLDIEGKIKYSFDCFYLKEKDNLSGVKILPTFIFKTYNIVIIDNMPYYNYYIKSKHERADVEIAIHKALEIVGKGTSPLIYTEFLGILDEEYLINHLGFIHWGHLRCINYPFLFPTHKSD